MATLKNVVPALNRMKVELTNGATITLRTVSPKPYIKLTRDSYNNPLWTASGDGNTLDDDSGRMGKFNTKFGIASEAWAVHDEGSADGLFDFGNDIKQAGNKSKKEKKE
jgi:ribosomal protein L31